MNDVRFATTETLRIGYEQHGPDDGSPVLLLHGWPYDIRVYDNVAPRLADAGHRVIVPYLRGFGPTTYRAPTTVRSGQQAALGKDVVDLLDALGIERALLAGYDWGGRAACVAAALWPDRVTGLLSATGYTVQDTRRNAAVPPPISEIRSSWYRWFLNTALGQTQLVRDRESYTRALWSEWSPSWQFTDAEFAASASSFYNPDWIATTLSCYRSWYGGGPVDPDLTELEDTLSARPAIGVPTVVLHGADNPLYPPGTTESHPQFTGAYERRVLPGIGHCVPAEAPAEFAAAIVDLLADAS